MTFKDKVVKWNWWCSADLPFQYSL